MTIENFTTSLISYSLIAAIGYIIGISFESFLGQWSYAVSSIASLGFAKNACGWKFK